MAQIVSAAYSRATEVMVAHTVPGHSRPIVTSNLLSAMRLPTSAGERYSVELPDSFTGFFFSVMSDPKGNGNYYSCISKSGDARKLRCIYSCLEEIKDKCSIGSDDVARDIRSAVIKWNKPDADQFGRVTMQMDEIKATMKNAMDQVLARGAKLEEILEQSEQIMESANEFNEGAKKAQWKMWCRLQKWNLMIFGAVAIILLIIILMVSGGDDETTTTPAPENSGRRLEEVIFDQVVQNVEVASTQTTI